MKKGVPIFLEDIDQDRFWSKVDRRGESECWTWNAGRHKSGYGGFSIHGVNRFAHRVSYAIAHGSLDPALYVCHTCDNKPCVNPKHLFVGTHQDNVDDMVRKGRVSHGEAHHTARLTPPEVEVIVQLHNDGRMHREIADIVGCDVSTVSEIVTGHAWSRLTGRRKVTGPRKGSEHPRAKLSEELVLQIVEMSSAIGVSRTARQLGLRQQTVSKVATGRTWSHVTGIKRRSK